MPRTDYNYMIIINVNGQNINFIFLTVAKDRLYNDVVDHIAEAKAGFPMANDDKQRHMMVIVDCLWYLDGSLHKLEKAGITIPKRFVHIKGDSNLNYYRFCI